MKLASLRLVTEDLKRLVAFYEAITALKATWYTDDFAELSLPGFTLALASTRTLALFGLAPPPAQNRDRTVIEFLVADVDRAFENGRALMADLVQSPTTMPWGNRSLLFHDPDGNLINFFTPVSAGALRKHAATASAT